MSTIVKMFVLNEDGDRVGTFVLDLESLFQMWRTIKERQLRDSSSNPSTVDQMSGGCLEWVQGDDGLMHLRVLRHPQPPEQE